MGMTYGRDRNPDKLFALLGVGDCFLNADLVICMKIEHSNLGNAVVLHDENAGTVSAVPDGAVVREVFPIIEKLGE